MENFTIPFTYNFTDILNKYSLLESVDSDVLGAYQDLFKKIEGSATTVLNNDVETKFNIASTQLSATEVQVEFLNRFCVVFTDIECTIDPLRLNFNISKAVDDEICISRKASSGGIVTLIINDDGLLAFSFIGEKGNKSSDKLEFYDDETAIDAELIAYQFFSL